MRITRNEVCRPQQVITVYLASPNTQQQAEHVSGMPVLLSFACYSDWLERYQQTFGRILIDSGAYSEMNSGKVVDVAAYAEWAQSWGATIDAWAGLDDIRGDWRRSLENYKHGGFPTIHDTDPPALLKDLVQLARERGNWLGLGLLPPRERQERVQHFADERRLMAWATEGENPRDPAIAFTDGPERRLATWVNNLARALEAAGEANAELERERAGLLRMDQSWPLSDILAKLIEASDILLHDLNYDGTGWELIKHARDAAKETAAALEAAAQLAEPKQSPQS